MRALILPNCRIAPEEARHFSFERIEIHRVRAVLRRSGRDAAWAEWVRHVWSPAAARQAFRSCANTPVRSGSGLMTLGSGLPGSGLAGSGLVGSGLASSGLAGSAGRIVGGAGSIGGRSCDLGSELAIRSPRVAMAGRATGGGGTKFGETGRRGAAGPGLLISLRLSGPSATGRLFASSARLDRSGDAARGVSRTA